MTQEINQKQEGEITFYQENNDQLRLQVRLTRETVWLTQKQMATLFEVNTDTIGLHLKHIFADEELNELSTTEESSVVQTEGKRKVRRQLKYYNLDAVISVGYRVNAKRGVKFRQWATGVLREHLTKGYSINQDRFTTNALELQSALDLLRRTIQNPSLTLDTSRGLLEIITRYTQTFILLQQYDEGLLTEPSGEQGGVLPTHTQAIQEVSWGASW